MASAPRARFIVRFTLSVVLLLLLVEGCLQVRFRWQTGKWAIAKEPFEPFTPHPYLVATPRPGFTGTRAGVTISHNASGMRGPPLQPHREGRRRIVVAGGSSTYCVGVSDADTWPVRLEAHLGEHVEVVNAGVPGYSTAEHVVQSALCFSELKPAVCVFYVGWNDMRSAHVAKLRADYSDFHGPSQWNNLLGADRGAFGRVMLLRSLAWRTRAAHWLLPDVLASSPGPTALTDQVDPVALAIYRRNLGMIGFACRKIGAIAVFVPQVMNSAALGGDSSDVWTPYVRDRDVPALNAAYGRVAFDVAREDGFASIDVESARFEAGDFLDRGHLSAKGCERLAAALAPHLAILR